MSGALPALGQDKFRADCAVQANDPSQAVSVESIWFLIQLNLGSRVPTESARARQSWLEGKVRVVNGVKRKVQKWVDQSHHKRQKRHRAATSATIAKISRHKISFTFSKEGKKPKGDLAILNKLNTKQIKDFAPDRRLPNQWQSSRGSFSASGTNDDNTTPPTPRRQPNGQTQPPTRRNSPPQLPILDLIFIFF